MTTMTSTSTSTTRLARALVVLAALVVGLAACGDDDATGDRADAAAEADASDAAGTDGSDPTSTTAPVTDLTAYCEDVLTLDQMFQALDAEDPAAFEAALADAAIVDERILASAPDALRDEHEVLSTAFQEVVETGDPTPYFTPEVEQTRAAVHEQNLVDCGWTVARIDAADFTYSGAFPTEPGAVSFEMANTGEEAHALTVARKLDEVEGTAMEAFESLEDEADLATTFEQVAAVFAEPGDEAYALGELEPGEYIAYCPIPGGTTGEASIGDGPPHFTQGMVTAFAVAEP
jgi:hypothetical protein